MLAPHAGAPSHGFGEAAADRQAQPGATDVARLRPSASVKHREQPGLLLRAQGWSLVPHPDRNEGPAVFRRGCFHLDLGLRRDAVFQCVGEVISQDLPEFSLIAVQE